MLKQTTDTHWLDNTADSRASTPRRLLSRALDAALSRENLRRAVEGSKIAIIVAIPLYLLWLFHLPVWSRGFGYDEQFFVWTGWSITKGLAPYRDFVEFKPPVVFLTHALAVATFGIQGMKFRTFFLLLEMAAFASVSLALVSRGANKVMTCAAVCLAVSFFANYHDTSFADCESIGYAYYMLGSSAFLAQARRRRALMDAVGAGFMALCFFSKEPFAPAILPAWLAAFFARDATTWEAFKRYFKHSTIGVLVVIGALVLYMAPTGALTAYLKMVASYRQLFRDPQKSYCVLIGQFHPTGSALDDLPLQWKVINDAFFNLKTFSFVGPAVAASLVFTARRSIWLLVSGLLCVAGSLYAVTPSNCYFQHYYLMAETGIFLFLYLGVDAASAPLRRASPSIERWAALSFVATLGLPVYQRYDAEKINALSAHPVPAMGESFPGVTAFVIANSAPSDRIVTTGPPGIYMMADRLNATRESTFMDEVLPARSGVTDEDKVSGWREDLLKNKPKIIILDPERANRKTRLTRALFMPFIEEFKYKRVEPYYYVRPD